MLHYQSWVFPTPATPEISVTLHIGIPPSKRWSIFWLMVIMEWLSCSSLRISSAVLVWRNMLFDFPTISNTSAASSNVISAPTENRLLINVNDATRKIKITWWEFWRPQIDNWTCCQETGLAQLALNGHGNRVCWYWSAIWILGSHLKMKTKLVTRAHAINEVNSSSVKTNYTTRFLGGVCLQLALTICFDVSKRHLALNFTLLPYSLLIEKKMKEKQCPFHAAIAALVICDKQQY